MNLITNTYINALLADAVYVKNISAGTLDAAIFKDRLTATQANYLAANFTVVTSNQSANGGFDAIVWQIKSGSALSGPNNENAGQIFLSMRGTQEGQDILDDVTLASKGIPYQQIADMVNWWLKNTAAITNTEVKQIKVIEAPGLVGYKTFALDAFTTGTGLLNEIDGIAGVNGHSLGGYLATAFTRIFGNAWGVEKVSTFNSAGFSNAAAINIADEYNNIENLLGASMGIWFDGMSAIQTNYFGENGIEFTTNSFGDMRLPGFNQYGARVALNQEAVLSGGADRIIANHYMYKLTDYLALGAVLEKLDTSLNIERFNTLIKAGSHETAGSYEGVLDSLRRIVEGPLVARLEADDVSGNAPTREAFHAALVGIQQSPTFQSLAGKVTLNLNVANIATQAKARVGFEEIVALETLAPFVLNAAGAQGATALQGLWSSQAWVSKYQDWQADRASLQTQGTPASYTDSWITDRALLLQSVLARNSNDSGTIVANSALPTDRVVDMRYVEPGSTTSTTLTLWNPANNPLNNALSGGRPHQLIAFGGDAADSLGGTAETQFGDHLYGGGGADTLSGLAGADWLEGGLGDDSLDGGAGLIIGQRTTPGAATLVA